MLTRRSRMLTKNSKISVGQGREESHPLVNPTILRHIFEYLDFKTLKSVRKTCSFWKEEANSFQQNKSKITITWHNKVDKEREPTLPSFMKYVESVGAENVFFRNYELIDWRLHSSEEEMTQFWLKCGAHIRNLVLKGLNFGFYEQSYVQNVFFNWTRKMETLRVENVRFMNVRNYKPLMSVVKKKKRRVRFDNDDQELPLPFSTCDIRENIQPNLNFHTFFIRPSRDYPNFPLQWKEIFVSYPNLQKLSVRPVFHKEGIDNIEELLKDLSEFQRENPETLQSLKHLTVFSLLDDDGDCAVTNKHFDQALKLKLELESLRIGFKKVGELSYDIVGKYLSKLSSTLKTLNIECYGEALTIYPPLAKKKSFPKLKNLSIDLNALAYNDVAFLEKTPALEKLTIGNVWGRAREPQLFINTITMLQLASLRYLHLREDILTEDCIRKIGEWFPNLIHFEATLDDELLWAVYSFLYNSLEELKIMGRRVTDAGITGMERTCWCSTCLSSEVKPSSSKKSQGPSFKRQKSNHTTNRTNIGTSIEKMKKLRRVTILDLFSHMCENGGDPVILTDESVYNGFALMSELAHLELRFSDKWADRISEQAWLYLCSRPNIITLDTFLFCRGYDAQKTEFDYFKGECGEYFTKTEI